MLGTHYGCTAIPARLISETTFQSATFISPYLWRQPRHHYGCHSYLYTSQCFSCFYLILFQTATHEKRFFTFLNYLGRRWKLSQVLSYANICQNNDIYKLLFVNFLLICTTLTSVPFISIFFER